MLETVILNLVEPVNPAIEGNTYQIHILPDGRLRLYLVTIPKADVARCPVIIAGEQCGKQQGHDGKHCWVGGD